MLGRALGGAALALVLACGRDLSLPAQGPKPPSISPAFATVAPRERLALQGSGGALPYRFVFAEGGPLSGSRAALDAATGAYQAGENGSAQDVVTLIDGAGSVAQARVTVGQKIAVVPAQATIAPGGHLVFTPSGGKPPYTFRLAAPAGNAAIDASTGNFSAGTAGDLDAQVQVGDATQDDGATAAAQVHVSTRLKLLGPGSESLTPYGALDFLAVGGQPPYAFSVVSGDGGSIDAATGHYRAGSGATAGTTGDVVTVTDAFAQKASLTVKTGPQLSAKLESTDLHPGTPVHVLASGGKPPYSFAFAKHGNRSRGSLDAITGLYTPGVNYGAVDLLEVRDGTPGGLALAQVTAGPVGALQLSGGHASRCFAADLNGDERKDLVFARLAGQAQGNFVQTLIMQPSGPPVSTTYQMPAAILDAIAFDIIRHGRDDLAVLFPTELRYFPANPDGSLGTGVQGFPRGQETVPSTALGSTPLPLQNTLNATASFFAYVPAGLNPNVTSLMGVCDVSTTSRASGIARSDAYPGGFGAAYCVERGAHPIALAAGDWNGDGLVDLAWIDGSDLGTVQVRLGPLSSNGGPNTSATVSLGSGVSYSGTASNAIYPPAVRLTPVRGQYDGVAVLAQHGTSTGIVYLAGGAGGLSVGTGFTDPTPAGSPALQGLLGFTPSAAFAPQLLAGDGATGTVYSLSTNLSALASIPPQPFSVDCAAAGDVNGDGIPDLVAGGAATGIGTVLWGEGDGSFGRRVHSSGAGRADRLRRRRRRRPGSCRADCDARSAGAVRRRPPTRLRPGDAASIHTRGPGGRQLPRHQCTDLMVGRSGGGLFLLAGASDGSFTQPVALHSGAGTLTGITLLGSTIARFGGTAWGGDLWGVVARLQGSTQTFAVQAVVRSSASDPTLADGGASTPALSEDQCEFRVLDVNGDGISDVVSICRNFASNELRIRTSVASGSSAGLVFATWSPAFTVGQPIRFVIAGVDGGRTVVLTQSSLPSSAIQVVSYGSQQVVNTIALPIGFKGATLARIHSDANLDLAILDAQNRIRVYRGDGLGGFTAPASTAFLAAPGTRLLAASLAPSAPADLLLLPDPLFDDFEIAANVGGTFP
jgi:hypothetical protein